LYSTSHKLNAVTYFFIFYFKIFWIYFLVYISKFVSFLNWILGKLFYLSLPYIPIEYFEWKNFHQIKKIHIENDIMNSCKFHYKGMWSSSFHVLLYFEWTWINLLWWKWPIPNKWDHGYGKMNSLIVISLN